MRYILLFTSLTIAAIAGWYSIAGLMTIFAGAAIPIAIMAGALEVGKLVSASWLHKNWWRIPFLMKAYLTTAVVVLMFVTSMGIFGFLSKAHLEQSLLVGGSNEIQIENLERQISSLTNDIERQRTIVLQLDDEIQTLIEYDKISGPDGAIAVREKQSSLRQTINSQISASTRELETRQVDLLALKQDALSIEAEIGPVRYIAELIYGDDAENKVDESVRIVILLLVFVFDPLAIMLLLAASYRFPELDTEGNHIIKPEQVAMAKADDWTLDTRE